MGTTSYVTTLDMWRARTLARAGGRRVQAAHAYRLVWVRAWEIPDSYYYVRTMYVLCTYLLRAILIAFHVPTPDWGPPGGPTGKSYRARNLSPRAF